MEPERPWRSSIPESSPRRTIAGVTTWCRATLNYADGPVEVEIRDGRSSGLPAWSECGVELFRDPSSVADWTDDDEIAAVHYGEIEALARRVTGCDAALVSDHVT